MLRPRLLLLRCGIEVRETVEQLDWTKRILAVVWTGFLLLGLYWFWHTPSVGKSIGLLTCAAAVMAAVMEKLKPFAKVCWIMLLFGLLFVEMRAIDKDKTDSTNALKKYFDGVSVQAQNNLNQTLLASQQEFQRMISTENVNFQKMLNNQQTEFSKTLAQLDKQEHEENGQFSALLGKQQQLFQDQEDFSEFLNGRLIAASEPTPHYSCENLVVGKDDVVVFLGTRGNVVIENSSFPKVIMNIKGQDVITLDRAPTGSVVLSVDMRDASGKLIVKLDKNGFAVGRNYGLYVFRPDKSTLILEDDYENQVLKAHFINPNAFSLEGFVRSGDKTYAIDLPKLANSCLAYSGKAALVID